VITLKNRIKAFRYEKGWTLSQLAKKAGMPITTLSNYERGTRTPSAEVLKKLADIFETNTAYLMGLTDAPAETLTNSNLKNIEFEVRSGAFQRLANIVLSIGSEYGGNIDEDSENIVSHILRFYISSSRSEHLHENIEELQIVLSLLVQLVDSDSRQKPLGVDDFVKIQNAINNQISRLYLNNHGQYTIGD
jgi:transcriptional regulator with XRE-family HTH domain